jgi:membrane-associated HD superfamily phosphohydrolase
MEKINKFVNIFLWIMMGITAILAISFIANISSNADDPEMRSWLDTNLIWNYILLLISLVLLVFFGVKEMISSFKESKKGMFSLLIIAAIVLVSYLLASDEVPVFLGSDKFVEQGILTPSVSKWVDTGLFTTYIFFALSIVAFIYSSVSRFFR